MWMMIGMLYSMQFKEQQGQQFLNIALKICYGSKKPHIEVAIVQTI